MVIHSENVTQPRPSPPCHLLTYCLQPCSCSNLVVCYPHWPVDLKWQRPLKRTIAFLVGGKQIFLQTLPSKLSSQVNATALLFLKYDYIRFKAMKGLQAFPSQPGEIIPGCPRTAQKTLSKITALTAWLS